MALFHIIDSEYTYCCLLGCDPVQCGESLLMIQKINYSPSAPEFKGLTLSQPKGQQLFAEEMYACSLRCVPLLGT
jgi:hypothetical protein